MRVSLRLAAAAALMAVVPAVALPAAASAAGPGGGTEVRTSPAPLRVAQAPIPNQYIVTLRSLPGADVNAVVAQLGVKPLFVYASAMQGFAAKLSPVQLEVVRKNLAVSAVEQDSTVMLDPGETSAVNQVLGNVTERSGLAAPSPWGVERITKRTPADPATAVRATGSKVTSYIIDSGIEFSHPEFGSRASLGSDHVGDGRNGVDCNGHGTHVAGTVGGSTVGVAKQTKLVAVRVFSCSGGSANSTIIAGINWTAANAKKPAIANLSLGGPNSAATNDAVRGLSQAGVFPVVAAGNSNVDACGISPASSVGAFTVGATDNADNKASFSNWGSCVDINAPGVAIRSAFLGGTLKELNGTSMASPHVAGIAALYKDANGDASFPTLSGWLTRNATQGVPATVPSGTPKLLAYANGL